MVAIKKEPDEEDSSFLNTLPPAHYSLSRKASAGSESEDLDVKDGKFSGPVNDTVHPRSPPSESSERPPKRLKMLLEGVVVRHIDKVLDDERKAKELKAKFKLFKNPKTKMTKKEEEMMLSDQVLYSRLSGNGIPLDPFPIDLEKTILDTPVNRDFMSDKYGGSSVSAIPSIAKERVEQHGYDDFMYLSMKYHPNAPQVPGAPGLFFGTGEISEEWRNRFKIYRVFTRLQSGIWLHVGFYLFKFSKPLSREEWSRDDMATMRNSWSKQLSERPWGRSIRCSIKLRRELGREPTPKEMKKGLETDEKYRDITPEDIARAFLYGEEVIFVWTMKCVGYDTEFQKTIVDQFARWTKPKKTKKEAKPAKKPTTTSSKPKKRKLTEMEDTESEDENEEYIPKGTQSRPHST